MDFFCEATPRVKQLSLGQLVFLILPRSFDQM